MASYALSSGSVYPSTSIVTFTTSSTLISTLTATGSPYPPHRDIVGPIEGLDECSGKLSTRTKTNINLKQTIVFESLANSKCNPADFPCICTELKAIGISGKVGAKCSKTVLDQYVRFQDDVCLGVFPPTTPSSIIVTPSVSSTPAPIVNVSTPIVNVTVVPVPVTSVVVVPGPNEYPTVVPTVPAPEPPLYTGGAAAMKMGAMAGAVGFMGLVFAGL